MEKMIETKENILLELPQKIDPKKFEKSQNTYIYEDLPVMTIVSNKALNIINSDEFVVKSFDVENERILLQGDDGELTITFDEFHKYFVVNYAITTHKSQGATYTQKVNIFDWEVLSIKPKLGYTAVSRAKNCEQITINV
jgi:ATP-dependent exoDNAse (exonuclease V) alpha subunit